MCRHRVSPSPYLIIIITPHPDTQVAHGRQMERPAPGEPNMSSDTPGTKSHTLNKYDTFDSESSVGWRRKALSRPIGTIR